MAPPEGMRSVGIAIVGGGISGLAAAWRLRRAGCEDFILLELEPELGGTSRGGASASGSSGGISFPWGAHYLPVPLSGNRAAVTLLEEMGVLDGRDADGEPVAREELLVRDPEERVFYRGRWHEGLYLRDGASAEDLRQLAAFEAEVDRWAAYRDGLGRRAFAIPMETSSRAGEALRLDSLSFADWARERGFTSPRLLWLLDYACRDDYGLHPDLTSAWAGIFYFAARLRSPGAAPQPFIAWPEGNGRLAAHLALGIGPRSRSRFLATDLRTVERDGKSFVEVSGLDLQSGEALGWRADRAILAAPRYLARFLVRDFRESPPAHLAEFQHGAWMVANLHLRDRPEERGFPLAWDNVLRESPSLGYVTATHQGGRAWGQGRSPEHGPTVLTYYYPFCESDPRVGRERLLSLGYEEWADVILADLERPHPEIRPLVERIEVMRRGHAMVRPRPGFLFGGAREKASAPHRGIHFAGSDLSGLPLFEEAFYRGVRAAEEVLAARGTPSATIL